MTAPENGSGPAAEVMIRRHIEEIANLYNLRRRCLAGLQRDRRRQAQLEDDIEQRLTRLVASEGPVMPVVRRLESADEIGTLFTVLRVLAERGFFEEVVALAVSLSATPLAPAVADAFVLSWPKEEIAYVRSLLRHRKGLVIAVVAQLIGTKRLPLGEALAVALEKEHREPAHAWVAWALGRLRYRPALPLLYQKLSRESDPLAATFLAIALLRCGHLLTLAFCREQWPGQSWPAQILAVAGDRNDARRLIQAMPVSAADADHLLAVGLAGDITATPALIDQLAKASSDAQQTAAASALYLLTGADVFHVRLGEGSSALDASVWRTWWQRHGDQFDTDQRYRLGQRVAPAVLLTQMMSEHIPSSLRQTAYEELVIRYGLDAAFEAHLYVGRQKEAVAKLHEALAGRTVPFEDGAFYFAGERV